jgi:hypothetical protein
LNLKTVAQAAGPVVASAQRAASTPAPLYKAVLNIASFPSDAILLISHAFAAREYFSGIMAQTPQENG